MKKPPTLLQTLLSIPDRMYHLSAEMVDEFFDLFLGMRYWTGMARFIVFITGTLFLWPALAFSLKPWPNWIDALGAFLRPDLLPPGTDPLMNLVTNLFFRFFDWQVLARLLMFVAPFVVVQKLATVYLMEIFNLSSEPLASRFITQAAFSYPSQLGIIHIREGQIIPSEQDSPVVMIGGPGAVAVGLENVAVFEKANGLWDPVGSARTAGGLHPLEGFERLREVIDLRDQYKTLDVDGRTRDGLRVYIRDLRLLFSVKRAQGPVEIGAPVYSYDLDAINRLVYSTVRPEGREVNWTNAMISLIVMELQRFISEHTLAEILATAADPGTTNGSGKLTFVPRPELSSLFSDLTRDFQRRAAEHGLRVEWVDVGIWQVPGDVVSKQHTEAWQMLRETQTKTGRGPLDFLRRQEKIKEFDRLMNILPLTAITDLKQRQYGRDDVIDHLLQEMEVLLRQALDEWERQPETSDPAVAAQVQRALDWLEKYFGEEHARAGASSETQAGASTEYASEPSPGTPPGASAAGQAGTPPSNPPEPEADQPETDEFPTQADWNPFRPFYTPPADRSEPPAEPEEPEIILAASLIVSAKTPESEVPIETRAIDERQPAEESADRPVEENTPPAAEPAPLSVRRTGPRRPVRRPKPQLLASEINSEPEPPAAPDNGKDLSASAPVKKDSQFDQLPLRTGPSALQRIPKKREPDSAPVEEPVVESPAQPEPEAPDQAQNRSEDKFEGEAEEGPHYINLDEDPYAMDEDWDLDKRRPKPGNPLRPR